MVCDPATEFVLKSRNGSAVDDVRVVLKVEGDILRILCNKDSGFSEGVRVADFIKHVRVSSGHIGDDEISFSNLVVNPRQDTFCKYLLVDSLAVCADGFCGGFNTEVINVTETCIERRTNTKGFGAVFAIV